MVKFLSYIKRLILSDSKESSKRFVFLYCFLIILTPLTFIYTSKENFTIVLAEYFTFLTFLIGGAIYQSIKSKQKDI
jgi:hypothetical protein